MVHRLCEGAHGGRGPQHAAELMALERDHGVMELWLLEFKMKIQGS